MKEDRPNTDWENNPKGQNLQKSTSSQKATFKAPMLEIEDRVFNFGKQKHAVDFANNCKAIPKVVMAKYNHREPEFSM